MDDSIVSVGNFNLPTPRVLHQLYILHMQVAIYPWQPFCQFRSIRTSRTDGILEKARTSALGTNSSPKFVAQVANNNSLHQLQLKRQVNTYFTVRKKKEHLGTKNKTK